MTRPCNVTTFSAVLISFLRIRLQLFAFKQISDPDFCVIKKTERTFLYTEQQNGSNLFSNLNFGTNLNNKKHRRADPDPCRLAKEKIRSDLIGPIDAMNGLATNERSGGPV
jgi:hypothetical protein